MALAHRARKFSRRTFLGGWLFRATRFAAARVKRARQRCQGSATESRPGFGAGVDRDAGAQIAPRLDQALDALATRQRDALLARVFLNWSWEESAQCLRL